MIEVILASKQNHLYSPMSSMKYIDKKVSEQRNLNAFKSHVKRNMEAQHKRNETSYHTNNEMLLTIITTTKPCPTRWGWVHG